MASNPDLKFYNDNRGYVTTSIAKDALTADFRVLDHVTTPDAPPFSRRRRSRSPTVCRGWWSGGRRLSEPPGRDSPAGRFPVAGAVRSVGRHGGSVSEAELELDGSTVRRERV
jgi:hypothetical protein